MTTSPKNLYGFVSVAETVTWTGLIFAMVARYGFGYDGPLFFVAGISHGTVFLAYCTVAVLVGVNQRWSFGLILGALAAAIPPYLTIPIDRALLRRGRLEGAWRTERSDHPGDSRFPDPLFRWFIARPLILVLTIVGFVALLLAVLLSLGSPTEWGRG
jgi:integral membrane protein